MSIESYPFGLRTILQAQKSRSQPASFRISEPRRGYAYMQEIGTDMPVFWSVVFCFTVSEAIRFKLWFKHSINNGLDEFTMPIRTEYGLIDHVCRFLPDGLLDPTEQGGLWMYKATILARAEIVPTEYDDAADIIIANPNWEELGSWLDIAMVIEWPEAA